MGDEHQAHPEHEENNGHEPAIAAAGAAHDLAEVAQAGGAARTTLGAVPASLRYSALRTATHSVEEANEAFHAGSGPGIGQILAPIGLAGGINNMVHGHDAVERIQGGLDTVAGGIGTVGLAGTGLNLAGNSLVTAGLAGEVGAASTSAVTAGGSMIGAGGALSTAAAAAAPVAAVAGAGAAGLALGHYGNQAVAEHGWMGRDEATGQNRTAADWAGDVGAHTFQRSSNWIYNHTGHNDTLADVGGYAAGGVATLGASAAGAGLAVGAAAADAGHAVASGARRLWNWL